MESTFVFTPLDINVCLIPHMLVQYSAAVNTTSYKAQPQQHLLSMTLMYAC